MKINCRHGCFYGWENKAAQFLNVYVSLRSLVKCGTAECGMRKVKCGIEKCGNGCGMVGKMRNAEKLKWGVNLPIIQYLDV